MGPPAPVQFDPHADWTRGSLLEWTREQLSELKSEGLDPRAAAEIYLAQVLGISRSHLYLQPDLPAAENHTHNLEKLAHGLEALRCGTPLQYVAGKQIFYGRIFQVGPGVFIPRGETHAMVIAATKIAKAYLDAHASNRLQVLDCCTGSAAVACTMALENPHLDVDAIDISLEALAYAQRNVEQFHLGSRVTLLQRDMLQLTDVRDGRRYSLITCNPPYASAEKAELFRAKHGHEPRLAIEGGPDGLDLVAATLDIGQRFLTDNGVVLIEIGKYQIDAALDLFARFPRFAFYQTLDNMPGHTTLLVASIQRTFPFEALNLVPAEIQIALPGRENARLSDRALAKSLSRELKSPLDELQRLSQRGKNKTECDALIARIQAAKRAEDSESPATVVELVQLHFQIMQLLDAHKRAGVYFRMKHIHEVEYAPASLLNLVAIMVLMGGLRREIDRTRKFYDEHEKAIGDLIKRETVMAILTDAETLIRNALLLVKGGPNTEGRQISASVYRNWNDIKFALDFYLSDLSHKMFQMQAAADPHSPWNFM